MFDLGFCWPVYRTYQNVYEHPVRWVRWQRQRVERTADTVRYRLCDDDVPGNRMSEAVLQILIKLLPNSISLPKCHSRGAVSGRRLVTRGSQHSFRCCSMFGLQLTFTLPDGRKTWGIHSNIYVKDIHENSKKKKKEYSYSIAHIACLLFRVLMCLCTVLWVR